ncbi:MAG: hypothetical protein KA270_01320 [Saprospiraceae bacterium]|nr:hypothetical protein [Saprospiraceae bacterium]
MIKIIFLEYHIIKYLIIVILFISCDKESEKCQNYTLRRSYLLENSNSRTETLEKSNNTYIDNNNSQLDNSFNAASLARLIEESEYFKDRIHFKLNFENNATGFFQDGKDSLSLNFNFKYFQDSVVILSCANKYEYQFILNDDCKLEHCIYLISTFEKLQFENYKVIYSTYCFDKTYMDVAKELLAQFGSNAPDTIGINKFTMKEN